MRVMVVRPREQAAATALRLRRMGHIPIEAPVLTIRGTGTPPATGPFAALLVTSRNAVPFLAGAPRVAALPVFAVGPRTAEALREAGFAEISVARGDAVSLAALVRDNLAPGGRLLYAAGRERRPEPAASLQRAGFAVSTWEVYAAEAAGTLPEPAALALRAGLADIVLHYSSRSAETLTRLAREAGQEQAFRALTHLCLSADVAAAIRPRPIVLASAREPSEDALLALLDEVAEQAEKRAD